MMTARARRHRATRGRDGTRDGRKKTLVRGRGSRARESSERTTRRRPGDG